jgi:hypothetical protein
MPLWRIEWDSEPGPDLDGCDVISYRESAGSGAALVGCDAARASALRAEPGVLLVTPAIHGEAFADESGETVTVWINRKHAGDHWQSTGY